MTFIILLVLNSISRGRVVIFHTIVLIPSYNFTPMSLYVIQEPQPGTIDLDLSDDDTYDQSSMAGTIDETAFDTTLNSGGMSFWRCRNGFTKIKVRITTKGFELS